MWVPADYVIKIPANWTLGASHARTSLSATGQAIGKIAALCIADSESEDNLSLDFSLSNLDNDGCHERVNSEGLENGLDVQEVAETREGAVAATSDENLSDEGCEIFELHIRVGAVSKRSKRGYWAEDKGD